MKCLIMSAIQYKTNKHQTGEQGNYEHEFHIHTNPVKIVIEIINALKVYHILVGFCYMEIEEQA